MRRNLPNAEMPMPFGLTEKPIPAKPGNVIIPPSKPEEPIARRQSNPPSEPILPKPAGTEPVPKTETTEKPRPVQRIHVVGDKETLSRISQQYYGTSSRWQAILQANSTVLKSPEQLRPGMKLVIPDLAEKSGRSPDR
jgi:nucleoid-associated protein YgaU